MGPQLMVGVGLIHAAAVVTAHEGCEGGCQQAHQAAGAQVVQVYPQLMAGEVLIQDASAVAAPGEDLTYWQLQARVHAVRQTLLGAGPSPPCCARMYGATLPTMQRQTWTASISRD